MDDVAPRVQDDGNAAMLCEKNRGKVGHPSGLARSTSECTGQLALSLFLVVLCNSLVQARTMIQNLVHFQISFSWH
jgi:hypothetical protein